MIIQNFEQLATSVLRRQALNIAEAGLRAINTRQSFEKGFFYNARKDSLSILGRQYNLSQYKNVYCLAFGKAAWEGITAVSQILGDRLTSGFAIGIEQDDGLLALEKRPPSNIIFRTGTHPHPSETNVKAAKELVEFAAAAKADDLVLCLISGGGSALLCYPHSLDAASQADILKELMNSGADIYEMNCVRKHLSLVKGGQLAKAIYPAKIISLIFSDVPGDDLSTIASGPTVKDPTTVRQASEIIDKYHILEKLNIPAIKFLETPKEDRFFKNSENILFVTAKTALNAMKKRAEDLGFAVKIFSEHFQGNAESLAKDIALAGNKKNQCVLAAGESTVVVTGEGQGGRNQHLALAALEYLLPNQVLVALATDGHDNSDSAGALVDLSTLARAQNLHLEPKSFLNRSDSHSFFEELGDGLKTGLTGSNVSDMVILLNG